MSEYPNFSLKGINIVHHPEWGRPFTEAMREGLLANGVTPKPESGAESLAKLVEGLESIDTFDAAITALRESPYFEPLVRGHTVMVEQVRNALPSDVTVVYRHARGDFQLESRFSVSHRDPIGPFVTQTELPPVGLQTRAQLAKHPRLVFGLHEFVTVEQMLRSTVYRTIYDDLRVSWHGTILARDEEFTWVLYVWFHAETRAQIADAVRHVRAGLAQVVGRIGKLFVDELCRGRFRQPHSWYEGLLVLDPACRSLRRQNFAAETILQGLVERPMPPVPRASIYRRIKLEYERRVAASLPTRWTVDNLFHPCELDAGPPSRPAVRVEVERQRSDDVDEHVVKLRELHLPYLQSINPWTLPVHAPARLATDLWHLGRYKRGDAEDMPIGMSPDAIADGYYVQAVQVVARPVSDIDIFAGRIHRYPLVSATKLDRSKAKVPELESHRVTKLTFRKKMIRGVLQAI